MNTSNHEMYNKHKDTIPFINFPSEWRIKIIPPFNGAVVRFLVSNPNGSHLSVYLDCEDALGFMGAPYWELYPVKFKEYEDTARFDADEVDQLKACIQSQLDGKVWEYDNNK